MSTKAKAKSSRSQTSPAIAEPQFAKIPRALTSLKQWVNWRIESRRQGNAWKWTKIPIQPDGSPASSMDARTWSSFKSVVRAYQRDERIAGIGFVTSTTDPLVLIDLDKVRDPATNAVEPWAAEIITAAHAEGAYTELSPSRTGFHIIARGPQGFTGRKANNVEMYCRGRFFTIMGGLAFNPDKALGVLNKTLDLVSARLQIPRPPDRGRDAPICRDAPVLLKASRPYPHAWTDARILKLAFEKRGGEKLKALLAGDISSHGGDASAADMACASILGFWFWLDEEVVERVMRNSELARPKWDSKRGSITYLRYTVRAALDGKTDYYGKPRELLPQEVA